MKKIAYISLIGIWLLAVFNPFFKKYDYGSELPLVVFLALISFGLVIAFWKQKRESAEIEKWSLTLFMLLVIVAFIFSGAKNIGFSEVMALLAAGNIYMTLAYLDDKESGWQEKFLKILAVAGFFAAVVGFIGYFTFDEVRMFGPFLNKLNHAHTWPNAFALFLLMVWPIVLTYWPWKWRKLAIVVVLSALLLTFSRGAILVAAGQIVLLGLYFRKHIPWRETIMIGLIVPAVFFGAGHIRGLYLPVVTVEDKVSFNSHEKDLSKSERITFWQGAVELAREKPLTGWGPFSFRQAYSPKQGDLLESADHPHNLFLKLAAEYGFPALTAFIFFLGAVIFTFASRFGKTDHQKTAYLIFVALAGAVAHNLIDYNLNFLATLLLFFLLLAIGRSLLIIKTEKSKSITPLLFGVLLAIFALYEGGVQALNLTATENIFMKYSLFPRAHYLQSAEGLIADKNYDFALDALDKYEKWNKIDGELYYLRARAYCETGESDLCLQNITNAIELNGLNEIRYYTLYWQYAEPDGIMAEQTLKILEDYFYYVEHNTHFTAYSQNVEAAAELIEVLVKTTWMDQHLANELAEKKIKMLSDAEHARNNKPL